MTVGAEKLLKMAEHIAANVSMSTDPDIIAQGLASHIQRFWDPRMREELIRYAAANPDSLSPAVERALKVVSAPNT